MRVTHCVIPTEDGPIEIEIISAPVPADIRSWWLLGETEGIELDDPVPN